MTYRLFESFLLIDTKNHVQIFGIEKVHGCSNRLYQ